NTADEVHQGVLRAFVYRIDQAQNGNSGRGPLPPEYLLMSPGPDQLRLEQRVARYKFEQIRRRVVALEPDEEINPYRDWMKPRTRADRGIRALYEVADPRELERQTRRLLEKYAQRGARLRVLRAALDLYPRLPPSFARSILETAYAILGSLPPVGDVR